MKRMKRKILFIPILIFVCIVFQMCEEENVIDPSEVDFWKQYTTQDGIISNEIWSIAEDLYGNIWVG